jgi:hypothetical protein
MAGEVVLTDAAVVVDVRLADVLPDDPAFAPQAGSNASAVTEAVRPHNA